MVHLRLVLIGENAIKLYIVSKKPIKPSSLIVGEKGNRKLVAPVFETLSEAAEFNKTFKGNIQELLIAIQDIWEK